MRRKTYGTISRIHRIYPVIGTRRSIDNLAAIAMVLNREQAIHLVAHVMKAVDAGEHTITVTGFRGRNQVTVTSPQPARALAREETA